jgi:hypothetical protein
MNYKHTKTIQKYSINKNLLLGLVVFAFFAQACGAGKKGGASSQSSLKLDLLGDFCGMTAEGFKDQVGKVAKDHNKPIRIELPKHGKVETLKIPKEVKMKDESSNQTKSVSYFKALCGKLNKASRMSLGKVEENPEITGLFKEVLDKFSEESSNKNAKIFVIWSMLKLKEGKNVQEFRDNIDKVKYGAPGVLVQIDKSGNVEFIELTSEDVDALKGRITKGDSQKYALDEKLSNFMDEIIKRIEKEAK